MMNKSMQPSAHELEISISIEIIKSQYVQGKLEYILRYNLKLEYN